MTEQFLMGAVVGSIAIPIGLYFIWLVFDFAVYCVTTKMFVSKTTLEILKNSTDRRLKAIIQRLEKLEAELKAAQSPRSRRRRNND